MSVNDHREFMIFVHACQGCRYSFDRIRNLFLQSQNRLSLSPIAILWQQRLQVLFMRAASISRRVAFLFDMLGTSGRSDPNCGTGPASHTLGPRPIRRV